MEGSLTAIIPACITPFPARVIVAEKIKSVDIKLVCIDDASCDFPLFYLLRSRRDSDGWGWRVTVVDERGHRTFYTPLMMSDGSINTDAEQAAFEELQLFRDADDLELASRGW